MSVKLTVKELGDLRSAIHHALSDRESLLQAYLLPDGSYMKSYGHVIRHNKALIRRMKLIDLKLIEEIKARKKKP